MLSKRNYWRDEVLGCILFNIIVLPTLETIRDICWLANLPEISNIVRTIMKTKMATSPTIPAVSHSGFLKILTRFHKKSTHRTLMYKTQKKSSTTEPSRPPCTATNFQWPADFSFTSVQIWEKFYKTDTTTQSTGPRSTKPKNCKPKNGRTCLHAPPKTRDDQWLSPSKLCKSAHNFKKLTIPGSSTALNLQDLKISGQEAQTRASTRHQKLRWSPASFHTLLRADASLSRASRARRADALHAPSVDTSFNAMTSCMTSYPTTVWPVFPGRPGLTHLS